MVNISPDKERDDRPLLKVADVARRLGISRSLVYQLINSGELPAVRIHHALRFRPEDVEALEGRQKAKAKMPKGRQNKGAS